MSTQQPSVDAIVEYDGGTIALVRPVAPAVREWIDENVGGDTQWFGGALAVEHRYIGDVYRGLVDAGFAVTVRTGGGA
jgi:hypothetical protein